jgi:tetratricopeptide (TPR) repeat protein
MGTLLRTSIAVGFLLTGAVQAQEPAQGQDLSDVAATARDMRLTLHDLDKRLAKLESLINQQAELVKKHRNSKQVAAAAPVRVDPTAALVAGQDAYRRGAIEENARQYEKAIELYTKAGTLDPRNELAFLHRGISNLQVGRLDEALSDVNKSLAIQPDNAQAYAFRGRVYVATKSYDLALADFQQAFQRDPGNAEYLMAQAGVEEQLGAFKRAAEIYDWASKLKPDSADIYVKRATVLRQMNEGSQAAESCSVAIRLRPNAAEGYACRSEAYVRLGLLPQAITDLNEAVRLEPTLPQVPNLLSVVREMLAVDDTLKKVAAAQNAKAAEIARAPEPIRETPHPIAPPPRSTPTPAPVPPPPAPSPAPAPIAPVGSSPPPVTNVVNTPLDPAASLRLVHESRKDIDTGSFQSALTTLSRAIELDPHSALAYNTRGYAYLRSRQFDLAIRDFSKAIDLNSTYANAYKNRSAARRSIGDSRGSREDIMKATQLGYPLPAPSSGQ